MAHTVYKYRTWCTTDNKWVESWGEVEPTVCPEDSSHQIDTTKTSIIEVVSSLFPLSDIGDKIAVHSSPKPTEIGRTSYAVWSGAGDDLTTTPHSLGEGELLQFELTPGTSSMTKDMKFSPNFGKVWIHEAYVMHNNGGFGDYLSAFVVVPPTLLQTVANKILYVEDNWVKPVPLDGSITPTHGFAATPTLMPRTFSHDGEWDYDGVTLTPNYAGTGGYKMSDIERYVHRFANRIPVYGSNPYFTLTSDETAELPNGYFLRVVAHNASNTAWNASVFIELYREMTNKP